MAAKLPFRPLRWYIVLEMRRLEEKTKSGIIIPEMAREQQDHAAVVGKVVAMGDDVFAESAKFPSGRLCEIGDHVMISRYAGFWWKHGEDYWKIVADTDLMGIVDDPDSIDALSLRTKN